MNRIKILMSVLLVVFVSVVILTTAAPAVEEGYSIIKYTVGSGVYTWNTGSDYLLGGTLGQHEDGRAAGGEYQIGGGMWPGGSDINYTYLPVVLR